jgi:hypothetical protein
MARFTSQVAHEVQRTVDNNSIDKFRRKIHDHGSNGLCRWMVQRIASVLIDDSPLSVQGQYLQYATKSIQENQHEEQCATMGKAGGVVGQVVEDTGNDHGLEELRCRQWLSVMEGK